MRALRRLPMATAQVASAVTPGQSREMWLRRVMMSVPMWSRV